DGDRALALEAVIGREGGVVVGGVVLDEAGDGAVGRGNVGQREAGAWRLGEREGDVRARGAIAERGRDDIDRHGRIQGVDGDGVRGCGDVVVAGRVGELGGVDGDRALAL